MRGEGRVIGNQWRVISDRGQRPWGAADPAEKLPRALEIRIAHYSEASKGPSARPSREISASDQWPVRGEMGPPDHGTKGLVVCKGQKLRKPPLPRASTRPSYLHRTSMVPPSYHHGPSPVAREGETHAPSTMVPRPRPVKASRSASLYAAEAEVAAAGADLTLAAGADHVTGAILVGAEERAAPVNALLLGRLQRVERSVRPPRVARDAARGGRCS